MDRAADGGTNFRNVREGRTRHSGEADFDLRQIIMKNLGMIFLGIFVIGLPIWLYTTEVCRLSP